MMKNDGLPRMIKILLPPIFEKMFSPHDEKRRFAPHDKHIGASHFEKTFPPHDEKRRFPKSRNIVITYLRNSL